MITSILFVDLGALILKVSRKKCISNWLMYSAIRFINFRLFIEKFTILYLMDEFEKIEFQENAK